MQGWRLQLSGTHYLKPVLNTTRDVFAKLQEASQGHREHLLLGRTHFPITSKHRSFRPAKLCLGTQRTSVAGPDTLPHHFEASQFSASGAMLRDIANICCQAKHTSPTLQSIVVFGQRSNVQGHREHLLLGQTQFPNTSKRRSFRPDREHLLLGQTHFPITSKQRSFRPAKLCLGTQRTSVAGPNTLRQHFKASQFSAYGAMFRHSQPTSAFKAALKTHPFKSAYF